MKLLRHSEVYQKISRVVRVPLKLRPTNILQHDKHYRELRRIWDGVHSELMVGDGDPSTLYRRQQNLHAQFEHYVALLIRRALKDIGAQPLAGPVESYSVGPWRITLTRPGVGEWKLTFHGSKTNSVELVFAVSWCEGRTDTTENEDRVVVFAHPMVARSDAQGKEELSHVLNPMRFFGVEWVRAEIERRLLKFAVGLYPPVADGVSDSARAELTMRFPKVFVESGRQLIVLPHRIVALKSLESTDEARLISSEAVRSRFRFSVELAEWFASCRVCGGAGLGGELAADELSFRFRCGKCSLRSTLSQESGK